MKILKQIFLIAAFVFGISIAASAQDRDRDKRPPKNNPPVIVPGKKPDDKPKENRPKEDDRDKDNRGKKPQIVLNKTAEVIEIEFI